ncbi:MAG: hypothetical protein DCC55_03310 [Chloroflexi bacterium]|nr:MAG: hypothetical protein DCC55_03310 [Chloroflexota bacterium]
MSCWLSYQALPFRAVKRAARAPCCTRRSAPCLPSQVRCRRRQPRPPVAPTRRRRLGARSTIQESPRLPWPQHPRRHRDQTNRR